MKNAKVLADLGNKACWFGLGLAASKKMRPYAKHFIIGGLIVSNLPTILELVEKCKQKGCCETEQPAEVQATENCCEAEENCCEADESCCPEEAAELTEQPEAESCCCAEEKECQEEDKKDE